MKRALSLAVLCSQVFFIFAIMTCSNEQIRVNQNDLQDAHTYSEGLVGVKMNGQWGFADKKGVIIVQPQFVAVRHFMQGLAAVKQVNRWGFIDKSGKMVIAPQYADALEFSGGLAPVKPKDKWGYVDRSGEMQIEPQFDEARPFSEGLAAVKMGSVWGYINKKGKIEINPLYKSAGSFKRGLAPVETEREDDAWGYINDGGKMIIKPQFDRAGEFSHEVPLAPVLVDTKWGFIDTGGKIAINPQFEDARAFSKGLAAVKADGQWGFLNRKGSWQMPPKFTSADDFHDELAVVTDQQRGYLIDRKGRQVGPAKNLDAQSAGYDQKKATYRDAMDFVFINDTDNWVNVVVENGRSGKTDPNDSNGIRVSSLVDFPFHFISYPPNSLHAHHMAVLSVKSKYGDSIGWVYKFITGPAWVDIGLYYDTNFEKAELLRLTPTKSTTYDFYSTKWGSLKCKNSVYTWQPGYEQTHPGWDYYDKGYSISATAWLDIPEWSFLSGHGLVIVLLTPDWKDPNNEPNRRLRESDGSIAWEWRVRAFLEDVYENGRMKYTIVPGKGSPALCGFYEAPDPQEITEIKATVDGSNLEYYNQKNKGTPIAAVNMYFSVKATRGGTIDKVYKRPGDMVNEGDKLLAHMEDGLYETLAKASASGRLVELKTDGTVTMGEDVGNIEDQKKQVIVRAPFDYEYKEYVKKPGDTVKSGDVLVKIIHVY